MTSREIAANLRKLADAYDVDGYLQPPSLNVFCSAKDDVVNLIKAIGGKFDKDMGRDDDQYASIKYKSLTIPGFTIWIDRSKACKLVRRPIEWDCEPLLSPEDEAEIEVVGS